MNDRTHKDALFPYNALALVKNEVVAGKFRENLENL
jgi:hypothetical protein